MATKELPFIEVRRRGFKALAKELGPVGFIRFLQQFETGKGDYSKERHKFIDRLSADEIAKRAKKKRNKK